MKKGTRKLLAVLLSAAMTLSLAGGALASAPPAMPGGSGMPPPPPGGGSMTFYLSDSATELESGNYDGTQFTPSTNADEVAVRAGDGVYANLDGVTITKESGDSSGDDTSFYGINSGLLVYGQDEPSHVVVTDSVINTSAGGANGVFAYGDGTVAISDSTVTTTASGVSGGIMVAGGGTLYGLNLNVTTEGGSSAAIRSDRGSGLMVVDQGIYLSNGSKGTGSPAIYCVADITVANATMVAKNAQAVCFEGRNPAWIYNCWLEGCYTASDDDENSNVMVYQSMSGDSDEGTSSFTMVGGVLKANNTSENGNAKMFYTTNTYCYINLYDVEMMYSEGMETFLLCACNTNFRGWGTAGANGSECVLYCVEQDLEGNIIYDTWSLLYCYFTGNTVAKTALLCREDNGDRGAHVYMDSTATWIVTGDSVVNDLYTGGATIVDEAGKTVSIVSADGTVHVAGDSEYTITVKGTYSVEDKSSYDQVPVIGTEKPEFVYDYEALGIDTSVYTPVGEADYVYTPGASISVAKLADKFQPVEIPATETPTPETPPAEPVTFVDVAETDWFHEHVNTVATAGLMEGVGEGRFNPEGQLSWIEAVIIAVRAYEYNNGGIVTGVEPADPPAPEAPSAPEGEPPAMPEGEPPAMPEGEAPAMPEGEVPAEGGGNGTGSPEDMVASYVVNADGTVAVTLSGIEMDTYSVNGTAAAGGQTVNVTPSADGTITVSFTGGGGPYLGVADYVFTPDASAAPPADSAEPAAPAEPEPTGDWTTPYIQAAIAHGIVEAAAEDVYAIITRAEAAVIFAAALPDGEPLNQLPADFFTDVPADSPAYAAVYALAAAGIVQGTDEEGIFGADLSFQRHSLATIAARMCGLVDRVTITVPTEPPAGGEPPAGPVAANFEGYKAYLISYAEYLWPGDSFLTNVYNEVGAMTEDNYASQMMYTILVNDMGAQSYDAWLALNS